MSVVEKVARAICQVEGCPTERWPDIVDAARAAISAVLDDMAEPSDEAVESAVDQCGDIRGIWQAMLAQYREEMLPTPPQEPLP